VVTFNKDFKYDLEFGEIREQRVADILLNQKIEVKTERGQWATTGNIAIEYEYRGQPSGITTTEAPYWMHILEVDGEEFCTLLFKTSVLRTLLKTVKSSRRVAGGDDKQSKLVLLPLSELFKAAKRNQEVSNV